MDSYTWLFFFFCILIFVFCFVYLFVLGSYLEVLRVYSWLYREHTECRELNSAPGNDFLIFLSKKKEKAKKATLSKYNGVVLTLLLYI